ncbi:hypothetical protein [Reyranella sp. CPCC 100927]|uniref:helix-turn-helix transcriptional regulator n=1 Tax=Reyranella sp. CPCC 100927 TaxID=2599616 RepID=UPI0011B798A0|nr:hypothetical protein [Reyranella sp. CPCC 100927]TWT11517.1 hypothetical protein FQU96_13630 [Reyranella sp. CPCC 100927]
MHPHAEGALIGDLYDAALGHRPWDDVGPDLVRLVGGRTLLLSVHSPLGEAVDLVTTLGMAADDLQQYSAYYAQHDIWAQSAMRQGLFGQPLTGDQLVDSHTFERSLFYNEFLRPKVNIHHVAGSLMALDSGDFSVIGIHRPRDGAAYDPADIQALGRVLPHLQRALEVRQKLQHPAAPDRSLLAAFDWLSLGVVLLGATGKLIHANASGSAILAQGDGLMRSVAGLRAARGDDDKRLQALLAGARQTTLNGVGVHGAGGHLSVSRPSGKRAYAVTVAPMGRSVGTGRDSPAVLVFIADPDATPAIDPVALEQLFDFTPAEARLVLALVSGVPLPAFSHQTGLSYNTVRTLLARAMTRTETNSQLQLVRLVLGALAGFATSRPPQQGTT